MNSLPHTPDLVRNLVFYGHGTATFFLTCSSLCSWGFFMNSSNSYERKMVFPYQHFPKFDCPYDLSRAYYTFHSTIREFCRENSAIKC